MGEEIVNNNIEKVAKNVKSPEEAAEKQLITQRKLLKVTSVTYYGLPTNKAKYLKNSK